MKRLLKYIGCVSLAGLLLAVQGCDKDKDEEPGKISANGGVYFKAVNLSPTLGTHLYASTTLTVFTVNWTVDVTVNGNTATVSGESMNDELPVMAGDEIEVVFVPACESETQASFQLPDGTSRTVTAANPSFRWTVPDDFTSGMKIEGRCEYEDNGTPIVKTDEITLISLKDFM